MSRGLVGIIANDSARYSLFTSCVLKLQERLLQAQVDSQVEMLIGGDWCGARNRLAELTITEGYDWLWFMDDDHAFSPQLLEKLLRHDLPLVVPVCLIRVPPFTPVTFVDEVDAANGKYLPAYLPDHPKEGLIELAGGGCAGMLIRREVLEAIEPPWFKHTHVSEDLLFCEAAKEKGYKIYCDLSARLGHITTAVVTPVTTAEGDWVINFTIGMDANISVPFDMFQKEEGPPSQDQ